MQTKARVEPAVASRCCWDQDEGKIVECPAPDFDARSLLGLKPHRGFARLSVLASSSGGSGFELQVMLADESRRVLKVPDEQTIEKATDLLCEDMHLRHGQWRLMQQTGDIIRPIPYNKTVGECCSVWKKFEKKTPGKHSQFVLLRKTRAKNDTIEIARPMDAGLSYEQAIREYIASPFQDSLATVCAIGAAIISIEREAFEKELELGDLALSAPAVLERLVPACALKRFPRYVIVDQIMQMAQSLQALPKLEAKIRAYAQLRKTALFGCQWFICQQVFDESNETGGANEHFPIFVEEEGNAEKMYVVALESDGVAFYPARYTHAECPQPCSRFKFSHGPNRLFEWTANGTRLELSLTASNDKRRPPRVCLRSTAAIDICFLLTDAVNGMQTEWRAPSSVTQGSSKISLETARSNLGLGPSQGILSS